MRKNSRSVLLRWSPNIFLIFLPPLLNALETGHCRTACYVIGCVVLLIIFPDVIFYIYRSFIAGRENCIEYCFHSQSSMERSQFSHRRRKG